jgi:hypothetical protein
LHLAAQNRQSSVVRTTCEPDGDSRRHNITSRDRRILGPSVSRLTVGSYDV